MRGYRAVNHRFESFVRHTRVMRCPIGVLRARFMAIPKRTDGADDADFWKRRGRDKWAIRWRRHRRKCGPHGRGGVWTEPIVHVRAAAESVRLRRMSARKPWTARLSQSAKESATFLDFNFPEAHWATRTSRFIPDHQHRAHRKLSSRDDHRYSTTTTGALRNDTRSHVTCSSKMEVQSADVAGARSSDRWHGDADQDRQLGSERAWPRCAGGRASRRLAAAPGEI